MLTHPHRHCAAVLASAALGWARVSSAQTLADEIHWTLRGQDQVTISWRGTASSLRYGTTSAYGTTISATTPNPVPISSPGPFREARLAGLAANTLYHYSIGGGPDHTFRTPPPRGASDFVVHVEGDIGSTLAYWRMAQVQARIAAAPPRFVLAVGDLTYGNNHGQAAVDQHFNDVMVWSQDAAYMPAWGNHEWDPGDHLDNYKGRFDLPNPRVSPGAPSPGGEDWYWFDYGNARFIAYPEPWTGAWSDWAVRADAVMDSADDDPAIDFIVTFGHRPAYSSGNHPTAGGTLAGILDALGRSHPKYVLNLNGHSHDYERTHPQSGVVHVTAGIGGAHLGGTSGPCPWEGGCPPPAWSAFRALHHGFLRLTFTATGIEGVAICGPPGGDADNVNDVACEPGSILDAFAIGAPPDGAPIVGAPLDAAALVGNLLVLNVAAGDPDGDAIATLAADVASLPAGHGATFTAAADRRSGTFSWTPAAAHAGGPYQVSFTAANGLSGTATTAITVGHVGPNLVGNPSFESGVSGWAGYHGASIAQVGGGHDGSQAVRVTGSQQPGVDHGINDSPNWVGRVAGAGTRYRFRAWVRSNTATADARLQIREYKGGVQQGSTTLSAPTRLSSAWQLVEATVVCARDSSTIDFQVIVQPGGSGTSFDVDDVSIQVVGQEPADVPPGDPRGLFVASFQPNPTLGAGRITAMLPRRDRLTVEILDPMGRRVRTLARGIPASAGLHRFEFDGRDDQDAAVGPGVYFYSVRGAEGTASGRFLVLK